MMIKRFLANVALLLVATSVQAATLTWTTVLDHAVPSSTNQLRGVALADDDESVYISYIQSTGGNRRVFRHDTDSPYALLNTHVSGNDQPKGVATDDRGNVFVGNRISGTGDSFIQSFTAALSPIASSAQVSPVLGGLTVHKTGATYYAYAVYEGSGLIQRYDVTNPAAMSLDATFGALGSYNIPGATDLRGIEVAADGTLYVASRGDAKVYRVASDLSTVSFAAVPRAMDVALFDGNVYATSYNGVNSLIRVIDAATMSSVEDITITTLDANPYTRGSAEGWSGIDIDDAGYIWLADQQYTGSGTGTRDRLLRGGSLVPEPSTIALIGLAGVAGLALVRRRQAS
jgi:hypothetical protein